MDACRFILASLIGMALSFVQRDVFADVVWLVNGTTTYGRILSNEGEQFVILSNGVEKSYEGTSVRDFLITVKPEQLNSLGPQDWSRYRDFAEELATFEKDTYAQDVAIRLMLIAAKNGDEPLRKSCLRALSKMGRTDIERRGFDQYCRQQLGIHRNSQRGGGLNRRLDRVREESRVGLLNVLQSIRKGDRQSAQEGLRDPSIKRAGVLIEDICSVEGLVEFSRLNRLSLIQLSQVLRAESLLRGLDSGPIPKNSSQLNWDQLASTKCDYPVKFPKLDDLTEFDLSEVVFRNGRWMRPEGK